jgi:uncharacterized protein (DUF362 family)
MTISRRNFLTGAGAAAASAMALHTARNFDEVGFRADVFIARASSYEADLETVIRSGLDELGFGSSKIKGKVVLLKPNLVEPTRTEPQINTHPALVRAAAEVFRRWQAREVLVAEGQGHCRDSLYVLDQSGLAPMLAAAKLPFIDLNHDDVYAVPNTMGYTRLRELMLPLTLRRADIIVSMPKMKTHHWAGVTLSMKNLFGVLPGVCYGWPKNVLHHQGIHQSIVDINATVRPHLAIVDGIIGMEGDGPIMGTPKASGLVVMGTNLPSVDATCARLMRIDPWRVAYLAASSGRLGPISEQHITQRGEALAPLVQTYQLLVEPSLSILRA